MPAFSARYMLFSLDVTKLVAARLSAVTNGAFPTSCSPWHVQLTVACAAVLLCTSYKAVLLPLSVCLVQRGPSTRSLPDSMQMLCTRNDDVIVAVFFDVKTCVTTSTESQGSVRDFINQASMGLHKCQLFVLTCWRVIGLYMVHVVQLPRVSSWRILL